MSAPEIDDQLAELAGFDRLATSVLDHVSTFDDEKLIAWVDSLSPGLLAEVNRREWWFIRRPNQSPPPGDWLIWLILAGRGYGKAVSLDCPIPVYEDGGVLSNDTLIPGGRFKPMGEIAVGDKVFDESGRPCRVTAVFDRMPERAYRVHFSDGTHIDACDEHQWVTWTHAERKAYLRSQHEADTSRFPAEWPAWRARRLPTRWLDQADVETALALIDQGASIRAAAAQVGVARQALDPHVRAGRFLPRSPVVRAGAPGPQIRTTQDIADTLTYNGRGDANHCIPLAGALRTARVQLPVDPWTLGYWLGNGSVGTGTIATDRRDEDDVRSALGAAGYSAGDRYGAEDRNAGTSVFTVYDLVGKLRAAGVAEDKHVPQRYLWAAPDQRAALLAGLLDSDGYCDAASGMVEFSSTTRALAEAVLFLARSLGQKPRLSEGTATLDGRDMGPKFRVHWRPTVNPFALPRKGAAVRKLGPQSLRNHHRMIVSVEEIEPVPMRCITVDGEHSMYLAGEAMIPTHNTRTGAETLVDWMIANPVDVAGHPTEWAAVGESLIDGRDVLIQGPSGVENVLQRRGIRYKYVKWPQPRIRLSTGQILHVLGADDADVGRGLNLAGLWMDEIAKWPYPSASWAEGLGPALRTRMPGGTKPRVIVTTTPKPLPLLFDWVARDDGSVAVTRGSTFENAANLASAAIREFIRMYGSSRTGRQELYAELLTDIEGALWKQSWLEEGRVRKRRDLPEFSTIAVAMDPSVSDSDESDETGLVCVARGEDGHDYVLADRSGHFVGMEAARKAWQLYIDREADVLVYESNQGMDWVRDVLVTCWNQMKAEGLVTGNAPLRPVNAVRGKRLRAEPVAARYEAGEAHHVGRFEKLEQQLTEWLPSSGLSPDRLDALVHGLTWLRAADHHDVQLETPVSTRKAPPIAPGRPTPVVGAVPTVYDPHARRRPRRNDRWGTWG